MGSCTGDTSGGSPLQFIDRFDTPARLSKSEYSWCDRMAALLTVGIAALWPYRSGRAGATDTTEEARFTTIREASRTIERRIPPGPVVVAFHEEAGKILSGYDTFIISEGIAWQLKADGWQPELFGVEADYTGLTPSLRAATAIVGLNGLRVVSVVR